MADLARGVFVALDGIDLSCVLKSIKTDAAADVKDSTTLCETVNKRWEKGQLEHTISGEGFFRASFVSANDANGLFKVALADKTGDHALMVCKDGAVFGGVCQMYNVRQAKYEINLVVNDLLMTTFEAKATRTATADGANDGIVLAGGLFGTLPQNNAGNLNFAGGTGLTGAAFDTGAAQTGYFAQVQFIADDGDSGINITIQHSTNGTTWVDLATVSSSHGSGQQLSSTSAAVSRYVRVNVALPGATYAVAVAGFKSGYTGI